MYVATTTGDLPKDIDILVGGQTVDGGKQPLFLGHCGATVLAKA